MAQYLEFRSRWGEYKLNEALKIRGGYIPSMSHLFQVIPLGLQFHRAADIWTLYGVLGIVGKN